MAEATMNLVTEEYVVIQDALANVPDDEDKQVFYDTLEMIKLDAEDKISNYGRVTENLKLVADGLKAKERKIAARRRAIEDNITWLKQKMFDAMKLMDIKKIDDGDIVISIAKNGGKAPVVLQEAYKEEPSLLPFEYQRTKVEADMDAIREALESGVDLDFAIIGERGESLRIK